MRLRLGMAAAALAIGLSLGGCGYNRIQELDEEVERRRADIGVQLTARNQLIPNMVATVQGAAEFERGTFTEVARARAGLEQAGQQVEQAVRQGNVQQMQEADAVVTRSIGTFINVAREAYPQLTATQNFRALQDQLAESENRIAVARNDYNASVQQYNTYIRSFPQVVTARATGAERKVPYQAPAGSEQAPTVDFGGGGAKQ